VAADFSEFRVFAGRVAGKCRPVISQFSERDIAAADIGSLRLGSTVSVARGVASEVIWDFAAKPLLGCATQEAAA